MNFGACLKRWSDGIIGGLLAHAIEPHWDDVALAQAGDAFAECKQAIATNHIRVLAGVQATNPHTSLQHVESTSKRWGYIDTVSVVANGNGAVRVQACTHNVA